MKRTLYAAAAAILAASLVVAQAQTSNTPSTSHSASAAKRHAPVRKPAAPPAPSVADQIQALRTEMQTQIDSLRSDLSAKDAQLRQAQQDAADARVAANKAEADAQAQQQTFTANASAVDTLQSTVSDLKANQLSLATTVSDETTTLKKAINNPDSLHYKGITLTPGGFAAGETVWRSKATGGDIPTAFSSLPYEGADAYSLSEFYGSARQSRLSLMAQGNVPWGKLTGYWEADWLGTGITSNNNQSNSYVLRQRVIWGQAATNNGWAFTGGQLWSLATEDKKGISNISGDIMTPQTIDPNYVVGFVWTRQYGFRVTKTWNKFAAGFAVENPQVLYSAAIGGDTPYAILGSVGQNGGNYNAAVSSVAATTYVQSYTNLKTVDSGGNTVYNYVPVYNTITANTNITNISFNYAPDIIVKLAFDPGWGHYEIVGIGRFAHELVFPGVTQNSVKYGGVTDIEGNVNGNGAAPGYVIPKSTTANSYIDTINLGGIAGSFRVPIGKTVSFGTKVLYGPGVGRYGATTLSDVTENASGDLRAIHNTSGLVTLEANPNARLSLYLDYGIDYAAREDYAATSLTLGNPTATFCSTVAGVFTCTASPTATNFAGTGGAWGSHFTTAQAMTAIGYGSRWASASATCSTQATPGYASGSVGYTGIAGSGCGNNTRDLQEITGGWWYDIYKGDRGRFRQGFQYGYAVREGWSGGGSGAPPIITNLNGAKGIDNMFWTSLRYYMP
jgi:Skp family chaperone for outer membrane proteins